MMKKKLSYLMLSFVFTVLMMATVNVKAEGEVTCDNSTLVDVVVHYIRWDDEYDYTDMSFEIWGTGTGGSGPVAITEGPYGGTATLKVNACDAADKVGIIPHPTGGWDYKDGIDTDANGGADDKFIDVTGIKAGTTTGMNVFIFQGSNEVMIEANPVANMGKLFVVYFRTIGDYAGWEIYSWGVKQELHQFSSNLGLDGGTDPNVFKVAMVNVPVDADDSMGFIIRKDGWTFKDDAWKSGITEDTTDANGHLYKTSGDRLVNVSDIKGTGSKIIFALGGKAEFLTDFDAFTATAFKFEVKTAKFEKNNSLSIEFNQDVEYDPTTGPDATKFSIKDADGNVLDISEIGFDSQKKSLAIFNFLTDKIDITKTYTFSYEHVGKLGAETVTKVIEIPDTEAPILEIKTADKEITVKQGAKKITSPVIKAFDNGIVIDTIRAEGVVDTSKPGKYTVTYFAEDDFGNVTSDTITVVVKANVMVYWPFALITLVVIGGGVGTLFFVKAKK
jgi:hypothetical protein